MNFKGGHLAKVYTVHGIILYNQQAGTIVPEFARKKRRIFAV